MSDNIEHVHPAILQLMVAKYLSVSDRYQWLGCGSHCCEVLMPWIWLSWVLSSKVLLYVIHSGPVVYNHYIKLKGLKSAASTNCLLQQTCSLTEFEFEFS